MTLTTAEELAEASEELRSAQTDEEKKRAATRFVAAERAHFAKLGIDTRAGSLLSRLLPIALIGLMVLTAGLAIANASKTKNLAQLTAELVDTQQANLNSSCVSGNVNRALQVKDFLSDARNYEADARFYDDIAGPMPYDNPVSIRIHKAAQAKRRRAETKRDRAKLVVKSIPVSELLHPNASKLASRSARDCDELFPI